MITEDLYFFLGIKLIKLGSDGFARIEPSQLVPQIAFDLLEFQRTWMMADDDIPELEKSIRLILTDFNRLYKCPISWMITANRGIDLNSLRLVQTSEEFLFMPERGSDKIELAFLREWLRPVEPEVQEYLM